MPLEAHRRLVPLLMVHTISGGHRETLALIRVDDMIPDVAAFA